MIPDYHIEKFIPQELQEPLKATLEKKGELSKEDLRVLEASRSALLSLQDTVSPDPEKNKDLTCLLGRVNEILDGSPEQIRQDVAMEKEAGSAAMEQISKSVFKDVIAPHLSSKDLVTLSQTSKAMGKKVALDEKWELEKAAITIGPDIWKQVGLEVKDVPPLPENIDAILKAKCPYFQGKRVYQTHRLVLMPAGLSIKKLSELMKGLLEGSSGNIKYSWDIILNNFGYKEIVKSYWVLATKDVIPLTRDRSFEHQKTFLVRPYEVSNLLETITLAMMNLQKSGKRREFLLPKEPATFSRCIEKYGRFQMSVGNFSDSGLHVQHDYYEHVAFGMIGVRRF